MSRSPLRLLAGGEAVAFAIHLQDVDVMSETVEQCAGEPLGSEYGRPFVERQIGGDESSVSLIALAKNLEKELGTDRRKKHIAQFVDDQQLDRVEVFLQRAQTALVTRFHELMHERGCGREGNAVSLLASSQP